ncbi:type II toxin-antitoxin system PemK/MazF family toxin [Brevibacillus gelatini]|uniref:Type II toxin-antitoxin system PemK/MazF family toxin n=1 Tax=Brevibacillus gelatini TaxID=1655277 RepID=A0A3M8AYE1_9BACL|nr:type II toxin-antitoxin system PemK/MazF family toxin [Brevibacillus gelatini]RNB56209.1 type II toxin-antitoxin system PemK/MazF family toxin [Brevibacillus gelatini]
MSETNQGELNTRLQQAKDALDEFYKAKETTTGKEYDLACDYLDWVNRKTGIVLNEKAFTIPEGIKIKRGDVYWIHFGYNIDEELGGKHPGIVLRKGGNTAIVVPLSTQEPTPDQLASGIYVEIDRVYNFKKLRRWVNVLNSMPISIQRFDFSTVGNIKGYELDKINAAMKKSGLWT